MRDIEVGHNPFLQNRNSPCSSFIVDFIRPYGDLNLSDMRFPEEEHTDSGLADSAADGLRQSAFQKVFLEWKLGAFFAAGFL